MWAGQNYDRHGIAKSVCAWVLKIPVGVEQRWMTIPLNLCQAKLKSFSHERNASHASGKNDLFC
jgi:hypothetical protein